MLNKVAGIGFLLLVAVLSFGNRQQDSVLNRIISVQADNIPVATMLHTITREYGIYFSYDASLVNTERLITLEIDKKPVREVLAQTFPRGEFRFIPKEDYIIISSVEEISESTGTDSHENVANIIVLSGKVTDSVTRELLAYVSVSVKNIPIGTITNQDGEYLLKLPTKYLSDTLVFSFVGYQPVFRKVSSIEKDELIRLRPVSIRIREVKVRAISVEELLDEVRNRMTYNYPASNRLLTGFYREIIRQDNDYISISEAVLEILKTPYIADFREDKVRLLKARKSPDIRPFHWVNFKLQGGPYTITKLDAVKTMETFLDKEYQNLYRYSITDVIWYKEHPVFVVSFRPVRNIQLPLFRGEMYIDRESFAVLHARFSLDNYGLAMAEQSLIRKKPRGFKVKPLNVDYTVDYQFYDDNWHLHSARANVSFRVRSREDRVNSVFESVSELLVTDIKDTDLKRFPGREVFTINDIFTDMAVDFDENFWGNYNIIKPDEDLQNAIKGFVHQSESFNESNTNKR